MRKFSLIPAIAILLAIVSSCAGKDSREVSSVVLDQIQVSLYKGETVRLHADILPANAINQDIRWESADEDVATVDGFGLVTGVGYGETTILAYCGSKAGTCDVIVEKVAAETLSLDRTEVSAAPGDVFTLKASYTPADLESPTIYWTSSNKEVAEVDRNGQVTVLSLGSAEITATLDGLKAVCKVVAVERPNLFDIYYEDDTYSPDFNPEKKAIGIVFWVGDPTQNDPELAKDHPACTHGLVVAWDELRDPDVPWRHIDCYWQNNPANVGAWVDANTDYPSIRCSSLPGEPGNDLLNLPYGYSNTKAIREYNKANPAYEVTAVAKIDEFQQLWPAPVNSSGWYLPSAKEGSLMWGGEYNGNVFGSGAGNTIQKGIEAAIWKCRDYFYYEDDYDYNTGQYLDSMYWVSNEYYGDSAFAYYISGSVMFVKKSDRQTVVYTRYIFAF